MTRLDDMIGEALATLPKLKDERPMPGHGSTCRSLSYDGIGEAAYASIHGSPWAVEVEVALHKLCLAVGAAIDADPLLKEIFERPREKETQVRLESLVESKLIAGRRHKF